MRLLSQFIEFNVASKLINQLTNSFTSPPHAEL
jgi:hypothetical protein